MAFMLLRRRLPCTFQHNYRLLAPSKPWGVLARTGPDGKHNPDWGWMGWDSRWGKGTGQPVPRGLSSPHAH